MSAASFALEVLLGTGPALGGSYWAYRQATKAGRISADSQERIESSKVEAEAFQRAKVIYESAIGQLEREIARVQKRLDEVNLQLSQERDASATLRITIRSLEQQVQSLEALVADLRHQIALAPVRAADDIHGQAGASVTGTGTAP